MAILNKLSSNTFELSADLYMPASELDTYAADFELDPANDIAVTITVSPANLDDPIFCDICDADSTGHTFITNDYYAISGCLSHLPAASQILEQL